MIAKEDVLTAKEISKFTSKLDKMIKPNRKADLWLYNGDVGLVLYFYYMSLFNENSDDLNKSLSLLEEQFENVQNYMYNFKFGYGIPGLSWLIQLLVNKGVINEENAASLVEIDDHINQALNYNNEEGLYDLFIGSIGKGLYFLERLSFAKAKKSNDDVVRLIEILSSIVVGFDGTAIRNDQGLYWLDDYTSGYEDYRDGESYIGIGMSHGTPSVIYFLGHCHRLNIETEKCERLIKGASDWLLSQEDGLNSFPTKVYPDGETVESYDLSWCYGIFSVAISLLISGSVLNDKSKWEKAVSIVNTAASVNVYEYEIHKVNNKRNLFFCHGTSGIAYMFHKFYTLIPSDSLKSTRDQWVQLTIKDFGQYGVNDFNEYTVQIIEGLPGINLALLSILNPSIDPFWDKMFLLDLDKFSKCEI